MRTLIRKKNISPRSGGFTLVEMSIVVLILGIGVAAFSPLYKLYLEDKSTTTTQSNVDNISAAIGSFRAINGRYPCPASLTATRDNPAYGRENCQDYTATIPPGNCDLAGSGICRELSERSWTYKNPFAAGNPQIVGTNPPVRIGAIPFRELNIDEKSAYDGYANRISYAVTEHLAYEQTFDATSGGIEIVDGNATPKSVLNPEASAHFLIFSHGRNGTGAFTKGGVQIPCTGAGADTMNCTIKPNARFRTTEEKSTKGADEYDDVMTYFTQSSLPLWQISTKQPTAIFYEKPGGDVGMNFMSVSNEFVGDATAPGTTKQVQINGVLRAIDDPETIEPDEIEGEIQSDDFCSSGGFDSGDCFKTSTIAGDLTKGTGGLTCEGNPAGPYMLGIADEKPICGYPEIGCKNGEVMKGIDSIGKVICTASLNCEPVEKSVCGETTKLGLGVEGSEATIYGGLTGVLKFICVSGVWKKNGEREGLCTCKPEVTTRTVGCGIGFEGTFEQTRTISCPAAGSWGSGTTDSGFVPPVSTTYPPSIDACKCKDADEKRTPTCPVGEEPSVSSQSRHFTCTSGLSGEWGEWEPPNTCTCPSKKDEPRVVPCGGNQTGDKKQKRSFVSCPDNWTDWVDTDTSACKCESREETKDEDCPISGYEGEYKVKYTYACPEGVTWAVVKNNCKPPPPTSCSWSSSSFVGSSPTPVGSVRGKPCKKCGDTIPQCHTGSSRNFQIYNSCVCQD